MVVFMDFSKASSALPTTSTTATSENTSTATMNRSHPFSAVIVLYPFLASLASQLDTTDLHNLASTCREFHSTLSDYRRTILSLSLRCSYPADKPLSPLIASTRDTQQAGQRCAKDLVQGCVRCNKPICRNCIQKPHPLHLNSRIRRLCTLCQHDPHALPAPNLPAYEARRLVCNCATNAWMCPPCAREMSREYDAYRLACELWAGGWGSGWGRQRQERRSAPRHSGSSGSPVGCARGKECVGIAGIPVVEDEDADVGADAVNDMTSMSVFGGEWELGAAIEAHGDEGWEYQAATATAYKAPRKIRRGGREVEWDGKGWLLVKELHGDARGYCNWCDKIVLSKADKTTTGLQ